MATVISAMIHSFFEVDELEAKKVGDDVHYTFVTTGILPTTAQIKTKIWALFAPPVRRLEVLSVEPIETGLITKRYKIRVKGIGAGEKIFRQRKRRR